MLSHQLITSVSIALGLVASPVLATGGFPPVTSSPGACGVEPADASCTAVFLACVNSRPSRTDPLASEVCVAAASCYPGNPDSFLANLFCRVGGPTGNPPRSATIPRLSDTVYNKIAASGGAVTSSSYSQWYIQLAGAADPRIASLIDLAFVRESFDIMAAWTGFCSTGSIPKGNFLDWFQYFSTVQGPATTCGNLGNCPTTFIPYCVDLTNSCASIDSALDNPFALPVCVAAALCWDDGIDSFLQAVTCRYNIRFNTNRPAPVGTSVPALTSSVIPTSPMTQNDFNSFINSRITAINGARQPKQDALQNRWSLIVAWTNFCSTQAIPRPNLSDLLRYSAVKLTSTTCTGPQCTPDPNASCEQLFQSCLTASNVLTDPYSNTNCALAATCKDGGVIAFGNAIACAKNTGGNSANPRFYPRLSTSVFNTLSFGDNTISLQNYIDSYYGALSGLSNPQWPDVNYVIGKWNAVSAWTAFPSGEVPYANFADFLQYS